VGQLKFVSIASFPIVERLELEILEILGVHSLRCDPENVGVLRIFRELAGVARALDLRYQRGRNLDEYVQRKGLRGSKSCNVSSEGDQGRVLVR